MTGLSESLLALLHDLQQLIDCDYCAILALAPDGLRVAASLGFPQLPETGRLVVRLSERPDLAELFVQEQPFGLDAGPDGAAWADLVGR